jgi:hypothetical protein
MAESASEWSAFCGSRSLFRPQGKQAGGWAGHIVWVQGGAFHGIVLLLEQKPQVLTKDWPFSSRLADLLSFMLMGGTCFFHQNVATVWYFYLRHPPRMLTLHIIPDFLTLFDNGDIIMDISF